jgi:lipopolysaccharide biosynthesis glycosyltransferase
MPGAFAAAQSILACGLAEDIRLAIVHPPDGLTKPIEAWMKAAYPRLELVAIEAADYLPPDLSCWRTILAPLFLRFALAEIFPDAQKILYVDSDILAVSGIDDAFALDLGGKPVAAADDDLVSEMIAVKPSWIAYREGLGVPVGKPYLNCGVLLIDAAAWREQSLKQALSATYLANRERCRYFDQSAINLFLKSDFARLSPAWNFQQTYQAIGAEDIVCPRLVHFAGSAKPWRNDGFVFRPPYRRRYREILSGTPFAGYFQSYGHIGRKQIKESWRSLKRFIGGRELQSGVRHEKLETLRARLAAIMQSGVFIDLPR